MKVGSLFPCYREIPEWIVPGKVKVQELAITEIFDLRSDTEIEKYNTPLPDIPGVKIVRTPVFQKEDYSPEMMAKWVRVISPPLKPWSFAHQPLQDGINFMLVEKLKYALYTST